MTFTGFTKEDFETFAIEGLSERMEAIQERIQPKFREIGQILADHLQTQLGNEMYLHIAKHARRTVNPPKDTWLAVSNNKRGYKQHPHFQVGLFDDHVFVWLAFIYELPRKQAIANQFIQNIKELRKTIPSNYVISLDHTKKDSILMDEIDLNKALDRFLHVKKAEFLTGQNFSCNNPLLSDGEAFINEMKATIDTLLPIYKISMQ